MFRSAGIDRRYSGAPLFTYFFFGFLAPDFLAGLPVVDLDFEAKDFFEDLPFFVLSGWEVPPLGAGAPKLGDGV